MMKKNNINTKVNIQKKTKEFLNENIPFSEILLINKNSEQQKNIITTKDQALKMAEELGLDLLCVSPRSNPPVCKLVNYQKIIFLENKKKKKVKKDEEKELRFSQNIEENDLQLKLKKAYEWIKEKNIAVNFEMRLLKKEERQTVLANKRCNDIVSFLKNKLPQLEIRKEIQTRGKKIRFTLFNSKKKGKKENEKEKE